MIAPSTPTDATLLALNLAGRGHFSLIFNCLAEQPKVRGSEQLLRGFGRREITRILPHWPRRPCLSLDPVECLPASAVGPESELFERAAWSQTAANQKK
jgi:hypothetical protein